MIDGGKWGQSPAKLETFKWYGPHPRIELSQQGIEMSQQAKEEYKRVFGMNKTSEELERENGKKGGRPRKHPRKGGAE